MEKVITRKKAIRQYCLQCCCNSRKEVRLCPSPKCPLYPFRIDDSEVEEK